MSPLVREGRVHTEADGQRLFSVAPPECAACRGCGAGRLEALKLPDDAPISALPDGPAWLHVSGQAFNGVLLKLFGLPVLVACMVALIVSQVAQPVAGPASLAAGVFVCMFVCARQEKNMRPNRTLAHLTSGVDDLNAEHPPFNITD